jgi:hypothetical protein
MLHTFPDYRPIDSSKIFFFVLSNLGEYGDTFLLQPEGMDLTSLRNRIVGNENPHAGDAGQEYCRIFTVSLGRLCWTFNHISTTGHSAGRGGVVYSYGCVFDASLLIAYANSFFSMLYSFAVEIHRIGGERNIGNSIERLVMNLNYPYRTNAGEQAFNWLRTLKDRLPIFESLLQRPSTMQRLGYRLMHLIFYVLGRGKTLELAVVCLGELTEDDALTVFNAEISRRRYWLRLGRSAWATRREYSSDVLVRVVPQVNLNPDTTDAKWRQLPSGASYIAVASRAETPME